MNNIHYTKQHNYKDFAILEQRWEWPPFSVCFSRDDCDYGDYETLALAKKAIDRFLKEDESPTEAQIERSQRLIADVLGIDHDSEEGGKTPK